MAGQDRQNGSKALCQREIGQNKKSIRGYSALGAAPPLAFPGNLQGNDLAWPARCALKAAASGPQTRTNDASSAFADASPLGMVAWQTDRLTAAGTASQASAGAGQRC